MSNEKTQQRRNDLVNMFQSSAVEKEEIKNFEETINSPVVEKTEPITTNNNYSYVSEVENISSESEQFVLRTKNRLAKTKFGGAKLEKDKKILRKSFALTELAATNMEALAIKYNYSSLNALINDIFENIDSFIK